MLHFRHVASFIQRWLSIAVIAGLVLSVSLSPAPTRAIDTSSSYFLSNYYYNSLISDGDFIDISSMSEGAIQEFLSSKGSYLAQHSENGRSAAKIVYDAAHGENEATGTLNGIVINTSTGTISPRAILVTLQKEQSLITLTADDRAANVDAYNNRLSKAMGYACPDSSSCDSRYSGFTKQVENAAWQLRYNYERAQGHGFSDYQVGQAKTFADYNGSYTVTFNNRATASLYRYTPHVFNGNYNFWKLFNTYFTSTGNNPSAGAASNDTSDATSRSYNDSFKISSTKSSDVHVYFGSSQRAQIGETSWSLEFAPDYGTHDYIITYKNSSYVTVAEKKITIERRKPGDINGDNNVDLLDLSVLGESFGQGVPDDDWRNLNPSVDSEVNILDLSILADKWGG